MSERFEFTSNSTTDHPLDGFVASELRNLAAIPFDAEPEDVTETSDEPDPNNPSTMELIEMVRRDRAAGYEEIRMRAAVALANAIVGAWNDGYSQHALDTGISEPDVDNGNPYRHALTEGDSRP